MERKTLEEELNNSFDFLESTNQIKYTKIWDRERMLNALLNNIRSDTMKFNRYLKLEKEKDKNIKWITYFLDLINKKYCKRCNSVLSEKNFSKNTYICKECDAKRDGRIFGKSDSRKKKYCDFCNKEHNRPNAKYCSYLCLILQNIEGKTKKDLLQDGKNQIKYGRIRDNAKNLLKYYDPDKKCKICGYNIHVECCHIKDIQDFSDDTLITKINSKENLIWLCPNHHYELDNNLIKIE